MWVKESLFNIFFFPTIPLDLMDDCYSGVDFAGMMDAEEKIYHKNCVMNLGEIARKKGFWGMKKKRGLGLKGEYSADERKTGQDGQS